MPINFKWYTFTLQSIIMIKYFILALAAILSFTSCAPEGLGNLAPLPLAVGKTNEIRIVCDQDDWEGPLGDSIRYNFQSPFLLLPNPEPMFDLKHFTAEQVINNLSLIHIPSPRDGLLSRMPSSA